MVNFVAIILDKKNNVKVNKKQIEDGTDTFKIGKCKYRILNERVKYIKINSLIFFKKTVPCCIYHENSIDPLTNEFKQDEVTGKSLKSILESKVMDDMFKGKGFDIDGKVIFAVIVIGIIGIIILNYFFGGGA